MILLLWLLVWLWHGTPQVAPWNAWLVSLIVCFLLSLSIGTRDG